MSRPIRRQRISGRSPPTTRRRGRCRSPNRDGRTSHRARKTSSRTRTDRWTSISARKPPEGKEANWVQTNPDKGWFAYFRFYGPTEAFFDKSWALPDIEKVNP
ncbi:DUF1214 domain-containing protein [Sinorhizobium sp. 22678]|uniref:DUF1214 domain-containing protein n=1 Tax=Sinorhizobium sp. 22678 TaxID=3453955 RepID=UPI003F850212